jgi:aconitate hydratase
MLAMGAGGLDVALAMAGEPLHLRMPAIWGVELVGRLPEWVSAKDVILEMLRRHGVRGGVGRILEYHGPGLDGLSAMDRHVIANMGTELGATASVFPSDGEVLRFLRAQQREEAWQELRADPGAAYDHRERIDLSTLEPLIAMPSSPGNVVKVAEVEGRSISQAYIGSSANPGYRDLAVAAAMVKDRTIPDGVSFDINPTSRQILENLIRDGHVADLLRAGARLHQAGCNGCIGMGQAPATDTYSLRTVPRNFPGRSGAREDKVCLVSPETAAASALTGKITDPRNLGPAAPAAKEPDRLLLNVEMLTPPAAPEETAAIELEKGPNITALPELSRLPEELTLAVLLKVGDDLSTDEILPAGSRVLPFRSNIEAIRRFAFEGVDESYARRAGEMEDGEGHAVVAGWNYGQGSSREHAALAPRSLGLRLVLARSFARIHRQNLSNFGVLPLRFVDEDEYDRIGQEAVLHLKDVREQLSGGSRVRIHELSQDRELQAEHDLSGRQLQAVLSGGLTNWIRERNS